MNKSKALFQEFLDQISSKEDMNENRSVAYLVFKKLFNLSQTDILADREVELTTQQKEKLNAIIERIKQHEPIQYILGEAEFLGRKFLVDSSVLIPRPETEELVLLVKKKLQSKKSETNVRIVDVGTGSGCIPISLALEIPSSEVFALDVSEKALQTAKQNAKTLDADVTFLKCDILLQEIPLQLLDVVVSNPPYVTMKEKSDMMKNVVEYEPHVALFVPDNDPLLFYKAIAIKAKHVLRADGILLVEINEQYGQSVADLFSLNGYKDISIFKDLSGKERIVSCMKG
jgi:release factor glutamine methyltransferase